MGTTVFFTDFKFSFVQKSFFSGSKGRLIHPFRFYSSVYFYYLCFDSSTLLQLSTLHWNNTSTQHLRTKTELLALKWRVVNHSVKIQFALCQSRFHCFTHLKSRNLGSGSLMKNILRRQEISSHEINESRRSGILSVILVTTWHQSSSRLRNLKLLENGLSHLHDCTRSWKYRIDESLRTFYGFSAEVCQRCRKNLNLLLVTISHDGSTLFGQNKCCDILDSDSTQDF